MTSTPEHHLATESFSYSWLVNPPTTTYSDLTHIHGRGGEGGFYPEEEEDDNLPRTCHSFYFDVSIPNDPPTRYSHYSPLVHADELFSNGLILPTTTSTNLPSLSKQTTTITTAAATSVTDWTISNPTSPVRKYHHQEQRRARQGKFMSFVNKYLRCWRPAARHGRTRVDDFDRRALEVKSITSSRNSLSPSRISTVSAGSSSSSPYDHSE